MGKPTGFLEYQRAEGRNRPIRERLGDFQEYALPQDPQILRDQAARCMDCGVPFCHAAFVVEGQAIGCPLYNVIPEINDLVYRGKLKEAYERLRMTHPFPEFTGRVCPALCEGSCTLGEHELPVSIREIERYVTEAAEAAGVTGPRVPQKRTGKRVAVVGSGPSGLACADVLNQAGHQVTVFERANRPGGLLMYGIPGMKLDKQIVQSTIRRLEAEGVAFVLGSEVGRDLPVMRLMEDYDAIVLCAGATQERTLKVPGADLAGVVTAMTYLTRAARHALGDSLEPNAALDARGKDVVVVGGGDTGTDCVATALRQGAKSVIQLEIMPELPAERAADNPWPLWPRVKKTDYGQQEAIALFGGDPRRYETTVQSLLGEDGAVREVQTVRVHWEDVAGRRAPVPIAGSERELPAQLVVTAMGFTGPEPLLAEQFGLQRTKSGLISTETGGYQSSLVTVFAAGDMHRGPSLVVWAIEEGRKAAQACDAYLCQR